MMQVQQHSTIQYSITYTQQNVLYCREGDRKSQSQPSNHLKILTSNNPLKYPFMKITILIMSIHILVRIVKSRQLENSCMFILDYHTRRNLHYYILLHYCLYYQKNYFQTIVDPIQSYLDFHASSFRIIFQAQGIRFLSFARYSSILFKFKNIATCIYFFHF